MKGCDRPSLDASHEYAISIVLMSLNKVPWGLLSRDCNERYALIGRFEPDNLGLVLLAILLMTARVTFTLLALSFLFLFRSLATWP